MKQKQFSVRVVLRKDKAYDSTGLYPLTIYVRHNGKSHYLYTESRVTEQNWLAKRGEGYLQTSIIVKEIHDKINKALSECKAKDKDKITFDRFRDAYMGKLLVEPEGLSFVDLFNQYMRDNRGRYSLKTNEGYEYTLQQLKRFEQQKQLRLLTHTLSERDLSAIMSWMLTDNKGRTTTSMHARRIVTVCRYLYKNRVLATDIAAGFKIIKAKVGTQPVAKADFFKIRDCVTTIPEDFGRDFWVFMVYAGGMEAKSIVLLKWKDVAEDHFSYIRDKNADSVSESVKIIVGRSSFINMIFEKYSISGEEEDYVFGFLKEYSPLEVERVTKNLASRITKKVKSVGKRHKIKPLPNCKRARPTFAVMADSLGFNVQEIQRMMGHSKINQTQVYMKNMPQQRLVDLAKRFETEMG